MELTVEEAGTPGAGLVGRVHVRMKVHQVGVADVWAIAADTDGIDGSEDNAGAVLAPDNVRKGGDAKDRLAKNDRYGFFGERGENRLDLP